MSIGKRKVGKKRGNQRDNRNKPQTIVPRGTKRRRKCSTWNNLKPQSGTADVPRGTKIPLKKIRRIVISVNVRPADDPVLCFYVGKVKPEFRSVARQLHLGAERVTEHTVAVCTRVNTVC